MMHGQKNIKLNDEELARRRAYRTKMLRNRELHVG